jgi:hypothetical protein
VLKFPESALQDGIDAADLQIAIVHLLVSEAEHVNAVRMPFQAGEISYEIIRMNSGAAVDVRRIFIRENCDFHRIS